MVNQNDNPGVMTRDKDRALEDASADRDMIAKYSARFGPQSTHLGEPIIKEVEKIIEVRTPKDKTLITNLREHTTKAEAEIKRLDGANNALGEEIDRLNEAAKIADDQLHNAEEVFESNKELIKQIAKLQTQNAKLKKALADD